MATRLAGSADEDGGRRRRRFCWQAHSWGVSDPRVRLQGEGGGHTARVAHAPVSCTDRSAQTRAGSKERRPTITFNAMNHLYFLAMTTRDTEQTIRVAFVDVLGERCSRRLHPPSLWRSDGRRDGRARRDTRTREAIRRTRRCLAHATTCLARLVRPPGRSRGLLARPNTVAAQRNEHRETPSEPRASERHPPLRRSVRARLPVEGTTSSRPSRRASSAC